MFNLRELKDRVEDHESSLFVILDSMPRDVKERQFERFHKVKYKDCPKYIQDLFNGCYKVVSFQATKIVIPLKEETVVLGDVNTKLGDLIKNYKEELKKRGFLTLSCPFCSQKFLIECTTAEDYECTCEKCGKKLKLKINSDQIIISVIKR